MPSLHPCAHALHALWLHARLILPAYSMTGGNYNCMQACATELDASVSDVHAPVYPYAHAAMPSQVVYPKRTDKPLYHGLVTQLEALQVPFLSADDVINGPPLRERYDVAMDAIFGFSFKGAPRPPFDTILEACSCLLNYNPAHGQGCVRCCPSA